MYSYQKTKPGVWTAGSFNANGVWVPESSWNTPEEAAERSHWLNGGQGPHTDDDEACTNLGIR